jgi:hypothetical protein
MSAFPIVTVKTPVELGESSSGADDHRVPDPLPDALIQTALNIYLNCDMKCNSSITVLLKLLQNNPKQ